MLFLLQHQLLYRMYHPLSQFHYKPGPPIHSNTHHSSLIQSNPSPLRLTFHRQWESNPTPISRILTSPSPTYSTHLLLLLRLPVRIRPRPFTTNLNTSPLLDFNHRPRSLQPSSLERLEMTKLKAESELQQSRLMEYEVVNDQHEQQKTRLEEEVKELMKRVHEMDGVRHKKDLDAGSKVSELERKVRRLELEREQLLTTIEALKTRHKDELANIDTSHKSHLKTLEDSYQRREQRLKDETDLIIQQNSDKFKNVQMEKADLQTTNKPKTFNSRDSEKQRDRDVKRPSSPSVGTISRRNMKMRSRI
ncbi:hypothetical protein OS493_027825 [Desmophyllum pertusum]|uniref:Fas-binding factor 1 C-terminal domain-containing protein n=1 Tax=Desmophyllum pertusum TaxID=174260 RepID=A0A9W9YXA0_9CNID|nr:hypothetical protein OS493_027825 [Desmophyllum pertusum]